ncbi:MAG: hypothetical protein J5784_01180 [Muribaculaceae bacterium]|nr:hypothetical protein [Muribaculaceae bacterium]MBR5745609.1 hypothetical protein [Muribaculaceae bacterium]
MKNIFPFTLTPPISANALLESPDALACGIPHTSTRYCSASSASPDARSRDHRGMFRFNPGIQRKTFPDYNPYTIKDCKNCSRLNEKFEWQPNRTFCRGVQSYRTMLRP